MNLLKQPLVHFLFLGALLFAVYSWFGDDEEEFGPTKEIVITPGRIQTLTARFEKVWQRPASPQETEGLINDFITEEVLYREALAIGLDQDDTIVRRRMRQKMEFINEDIVDQIEPDEKTLQAYLDENKDSYRFDPTLSFTQIYINPENHGESTEQVAQDLLARLNKQNQFESAEELGDRIMLNARFDDTSLREINRQFGKGFGESLLELEAGTWQGPVVSGFGLHLIQVKSRTEGRLATLDEVRAEVKRDWISQRTRESSEKFIELLKSNYVITIEYPKAESVAINDNRQSNAKAL